MKSKVSLIPREGVSFLSARVEGFRPGRARLDRPALDLDRGVTSTGPAAADGVEAERQFRIAPGLRPVGGTVKLNPAHHHTHWWTTQTKPQAPPQPQTSETNDA
jgi:hypothetical protein